MKVEIFELNSTVAIHSPFEPIRYESFFYELGHDDDIVSSFKLLETVNDDSVRELSFAQRKCLFYDEEEPQFHLGFTQMGHLPWTGSRGRDRDRKSFDSNPVYSLNLCLLVCRAETAIALCGCKPHFYSRIGSWLDEKGRSHLLSRRD